METFVGPAALLALVRDALLLRYSTYEEVCRYPAATKLCLAVAVLAGAATGFVLGAGDQIVEAVAIVFGIFVTFGILLFEAAIVWVLFRVILRRAHTFGSVLRPLALAHAPRLGFLVVLFLEDRLALFLWSNVLRAWTFGALLVALRALSGGSWILGILVGAVLSAIVWEFA